MMIPRTPALAVTVAVAAVTVAAPPASARPAAIDWHPCASPGQAAATADCATLQLPIDWADPAAGTFGFEIARRTATDPSARIGTLIFGPGGPGDSGVGRISTGQARFSEELRRRFDIVSFDPRGVGASHPIKCPAGPPAPALLTSQADFDRTLAENRARWQGCRNLTGPLFDHADSASTVRDLDALRAALGERTLTFHGSSYGTMLGELYAERYPHRVRAIVLESAVDHSRRVGSFLTTQAWALQDSFDAFVDWCTPQQSACRLRGADVRARWADLMDRAGRGELTLPQFQLVANAHKLLAGPNYPGLADFIVTMGDGDKGDVQKLEPVLAVFCADWSLPVRDYDAYRRLLGRAAAQAPDVRYPAGVLALPACLGWPQPVANPQHRLRVHTRTPLLLINARHDPASGYNWASEVARQLGRHGVLLTYDGAGHGSYSRSDCIEQAVDAYLISLTVPPRGTVCPAA
jgi:pimeloyl-ACP methyl ester carboxylesterase